VLQGRLSAAVPVAAGLLAGAVLVGCSGDDAADDTIPSIELTRVTAAPGDDAEGQVACALDASQLRNALEAFRIDQGRAAPDEAALVDGGYLIVASSLWDVVDGRLVAEDPACDGVPADPPAAEIVTGGSDTDRDELGEQLASITPDDVLAGLTTAEIDAVGGPECAREVAQVTIAYQRWRYDHADTDPETMRRLADEGYVGPLELWEVGDTALVAADGSPCLGPIEVLAG
jgi:hypothetical protein